ncbi:DNA replication/repair protein RecF [Clostridium cylindrosporum]|uniref:DNA replication and repair protein RecF n=1 Tax=Clostridium cylindrosporum DSM 605 TaxID=1121307 RepID=A0A0J8DBS0_CLOCY|nr:DNA replication/repair protein RecF [Clostridium cylindrosporum]KMT21738.1 DNA replication and repair protein RecF [Clostridium cylindrosporum DSM 605]
MYVKNLQVKNYRNYDNININLSKSLNIFLGENAQGKTNLAEAIYFLSSLKSHRTSKNKDIIAWNKDDTYIKAVVSRLYGEDVLEILISSKEKNYIKVNGVKATKASEVLGRLNVVMFSPEDLKLVKEGPVLRRKFLDFELSQIRPKYHYLINRYNKILNQRNNLLKSLQFSRDMISTLDVFTDQLIEAACDIMIMRRDFLIKISEISKLIHNKITSGTEELEIEYICDVKDFQSKEDIKTSLEKKLKDKRKSEIKKGYTLAGPHRDDIMIKINGIDVRSFGSQGQQRSAALSLKLSEIDIINSITGEYPVLILDDVLSELDENRQRYLIDNLNHVQTILTCTSGSDVDMFSSEDKNVFFVSNGNLSIGQ